MLARLLAGSVLITWPALFVADELPSDGWLNGKIDDFLTGGIAVLLVVGLLAAGWLTPLRAVLAAVFLYGFALPILYEIISPTECPAGTSGMDCIPESFAAVWTLPGLLLILVGWAARRTARSPGISLLPAKQEAARPPS